MKTDSPVLMSRPTFYQNVRWPADTCGQWEPLQHFDNQ